MPTSPSRFSRDCVATLPGAPSRVGRRGIVRSPLSAPSGGARRFAVGLGIIPALFVLLALPASPAHAQVAFAPPASYAGAQGGATNIVAGDFLGQDGIPDVAVGSGSSCCAFVLSGAGDGTLQPQGTLSTGNGPYLQALGDIDGDGQLDLVSSNQFSGNVSVFISQTDGLVAEAPVPFGTFTTGVALGDLDGDGILDLVATHQGPSDRALHTDLVGIRLGQGGGSFGPQRDYPVGNEPSFVRVSDLNADGDLDLVVANNNSNNVSVLLGAGDGSFGATVDYPAGSHSGGAIQGFAVADLTGDGVPDLALPSLGTDDVALLVGAGDGSFGAPISLSAGDAPRSVAAGDLDGDGATDLVSANAGSGDLTVLLANGLGGFEPPLSFSLGASVVEPKSVTLSDLDGDGRLDLIAAADGATIVLLNQSTGSPVDHLQNLVDAYLPAGPPGNAGIANALKSKLARGQVDSFINQVRAQCCSPSPGKRLTSEQADALIRFAEAL